MPGKRLQLAIQKSGRLSEASIKLLKKCDIRFDNGLGKLRSSAFNFPLDILFLRDDDIPQYVADGVADCGIVGENVYYESGSELEILQHLGFGKCRLSLAVVKGSRYESLSSLTGKKIATSYPQLLSAFLEKNAVEAEVHTISGSVEIAPSIGVSDAICDLVSSGNTLFTNGLEEVATVMESEAVLVSRRDLGEPLKSLLKSLEFRFSSVNEALNNKYILLNAPIEKIREIEEILPGIKSPTILPLAKEGWCSVHSVIGVKDSWETIEQLKSAGAEGILVIAIDQMVR